MGEEVIELKLQGGKSEGKEEARTLNAVSHSPNWCNLTSTSNPWGKY